MNKILHRTSYLTVAIVVVMSAAQPLLARLLPQLGGVAYAFSGGDGSVSNPYQVATCDDLESLTTGDTSVHYVLTQDIDCSGVNGGVGFNPIGGFNASQFKGVLDGHNYTVSNITVDAAGQTYAGMFGVVESATIKNLKLDHTTIDNADYSVGTLAGFMSYTTVSHVSSTNFTINESAAGWDIGGLVGLYGSGDGGVTLNTMDSTYAQGVINSSSIGGAAYGGLVGELDYDTVTNSYADVAINASGIQRAGGLVGYSYYGHIDKNYATGSLSVYSNAGSLVGWGYTGSVITNNFALTNITTVNGTSGGIAGQLTGDASLANNYYDQTATGQSGCDFTGVVVGCVAVNTDGTDGSHFKNTSSVAPLSSWNFVSPWQTTVNYPTLQDVTGTVPDAVRSLQDEEGDGQILLNWMVPSSDGGSPISDYLVQYRIHPSGSWSNIDTHSTLTNATITGLVDGTAYDVAVAAVNGVGTGNYSELDNLTPGTFPGAPVGVHGTVSFASSSIELDWNEPNSDGGSVITGYRVSIRDKDGANTWSVPVSLPVNTFSYTFTGLAVGHHYDLDVVAVNAFGTSVDALASNLAMVNQVYDITNCDQLQAINNDLAGHYRLMNDIDCSATSTWNGGNGFIPIDNGALGDGFTGTFDGQGHTIENLFINSPDDDAGLFSALIGGAKISNLTLTGTVTGGANTAGLVAIATNGVTIDHVNVQMNVTATNTDGGFFVVSGTGGIAGLAGIDVVISHSSVSGFVVDYSDGTKPEAVGGLVGVMLDGTTVSDSYANVDTGTPNNGQFYLGGITGMMIAYLGVGQIYVLNSYATGVVAGGDGTAIGGLAGAVGGGEIDNSFADNNLYTTASVPQMGGIVGYSMSTVLNNVYFDESMASVSTCDPSGSLSGCTSVNAGGSDGGYFKGNHTNAPLNLWDFDTIWQTQDGDYPILRAVPVAPTEDGSSGSGGSSSNSTGNSTTSSNQPTASESRVRTPTSDLTAIDLNHIADYVSGHGVALNLSVGQVLHFTITQNGTPEQHSITVVSITGSSVTLQIASKPFELQLTTGETKIIAIEGQSVMKVTLALISDGQATIVFSALTTRQPTMAKSLGSPSAPINIIVISAAFMATVFLGGVLIVALRRRLIFS